MDIGDVLIQRSGDDLHSDSHNFTWKAMSQEAQTKVINAHKKVADDDEDDKSSTSAKSAKTVKSISKTMKSLKKDNHRLKKSVSAL